MTTGADAGTPVDPFAGLDDLGIEPVEIGVFGGSGFSGLSTDAEAVTVDTPWGAPAAPVSIAEFAGRRVAFLPRHGVRHEYAPHTIPYRANVAAMRRLGVRFLIGPCAVGSLQRDVEPGHFVACDQLVDLTRGRHDTFFDSDALPVTHIGFAEPYCGELRPLAVDACRAAGVTVHDGGTVVVIPGPRFATRAESQWYSAQGWQIINMTQYPEAALAREAQMCYVNLSLVTDYDAGFTIDSGIPPVTVDEILAVFAANNERLRTVLEHLVASIPPADDVECAAFTALDGAQL